MKRAFALALFASSLAVFGGAAWSADETTKRDDASARTPALSDEQFFKHIAQVHLAEINLGRLAGRRAEKQDVKDYGRLMHDDHMKALDDLRPIAEKKGWRIPDDPNPEQKATYERLDRLQGAAFDREFMQVMVKDHEKVISMVEGFARDGRDGELKAYANKVLPHLKHHLEKARDLEKRVAG